MTLADIGNWRGVVRFMASQGAVDGRAYVRGQDVGDTVEGAGVQTVRALVRRGMVATGEPVPTPGQPRRRTDVYTLDTRDSRVRMVMEAME